MPSFLDEERDAVFSEFMELDEDGSLGIGCVVFMDGGGSGMDGTLSISRDCFWGRYPGDGIEMA